MLYKSFNLKDLKDLEQYWKEKIKLHEKETFIYKSPDL